MRTAKCQAKSVNSVTPQLIYGMVWMHAIYWAFVSKRKTITTVWEHALSRTNVPWSHWSHDCNFTLSPQKNFAGYPPAWFSELIIAILHSPFKKNFRRLMLALFGYLMIVILHYLSPHKKIWPATAGIIWSFHDCNFTLSLPQKKITPAAAGII